MNRVVDRTRPPRPSPDRGRRRAASPVFVDRSGRRRRIVMATAGAAAVMVVLALVTFVAALFGASPVPLPGLPELGRPAPSAPGPVQQRPARTTAPQTPGGGSATAPPGATASAAPITPDPPGSSRRHVPTQTPTDKGKPSQP